jgi:hypothetical protein
MEALTPASPDSLPPLGSPHWSRVWPTSAENPRHAGLERWMATYGHQIIGQPADTFDLYQDN